jgi:pyruvate,orthophosphate dikinase
MSYIYFFGDKKDINFPDNLRFLVGNKGAGLIQMAQMGIPVPPGFIITTEVCSFYFKHNKYPEDFEEELEENISQLEETTGKSFGDTKKPLLVSVRSGAAVSMPGMMDTVLNLGMNDEIAFSLAQLLDKRVAYDSYRRFIQMFLKVVLKSDIDFEGLLEEFKRKKNKKYDIELSGDDFVELIDIYKEKLKEKNLKFPDLPREQLHLAIKAVFNSWNNPRAITYRKLHNIPDDLGTAVTVQSMVFGNLSDNSGTGVAFTRNPATGENQLFGEYLMKAQGEDVVAGIRTPSSISRLKEDMPKIYSQLVNVCQKLERFYKDMQDIEFTIEDNKFYMLQTRTGKRTARAAIKIAVDLVKEKIITKEEAIRRINPSDIDQLLHKHISPNEKVKVIAKGLGASPGAATGRIVFTPQTACEYKKNNIPCILIRPETSPDDIAGIASAEGVLTAKGGMTSHAAVVTRGMGKPCVVGCEELQIKETEKKLIIGDKEYNQGEIITIDGTEGNVIEGEVKLIEPELTEEAKLLLSWADEIRRLKVRANADTPPDVIKAKELGAEGVGLCRTEHMFFGDRLPIMQEMILAKTKEERKSALEKLQPLQKQDFIEIFKAMEGLPVVIRLLDPPLHEFLPKEDETLTRKNKALVEKIQALKEVNPMLGFRGCRLGIIYPEIVKMQVTAILEAACELRKSGFEVNPEIMIPLVAHVNEFIKQYELIKEVAQDVMSKYNLEIQYTIGTMIELPRAALTADKIAKFADFFSFGTNDLTQTTYGLSRDDAEGRFLDKYLEYNILKENPFAVIDEEGVGELMRIGISKGKSANPKLKIGICGEHGGDPKSIEFCEGLGLDYVSCSPYRVPIARIAAAKATLEKKKSFQEGE